MGDKLETITKAPFSKARTNLDPDILKESFEMTVQTLVKCDDLKLYKNRYRLCAIDGSDITLDNAKELLEHFGGSGKKKDCASAMVSLCYDPLNNIVLDGGLYPYGKSEREAAKAHFAAMDALGTAKGVDNLYINDRGYPSKELFADMIDSGRFFLMRVRRKFSSDITLDSGEKEILVTNLPKKHLKYKEAAELFLISRNDTPAGEVFELQLVFQAVKLGFNAPALEVQNRPTQTAQKQEVLRQM